MSDMIRPTLAAKIALAIGVAVTILTLVQIGVRGIDVGSTFFLLIGLALTLLSIYVLRKLNRGTR